MDILNVIWSVLSFAFSLIWAVVWFVVRDLLSTVFWILIVVWLVLGVRYRSFAAGSLALLRYGRYGLRLFWSWLRGAPPTMPYPLPSASDRIERQRARRRVPFGYMSVSDQLNLLVVSLFYLRFFV